jgi:hypothetical protein
VYCDVPMWINDNNSSELGLFAVSKFSGHFLCQVVFARGIFIFIFTFIFKDHFQGSFSENQKVKVLSNLNMSWIPNKFIIEFNFHVNTSSVCRFRDGSYKLIHSRALVQSNFAIRTMGQSMCVPVSVLSLMWFHQYTKAEPNSPKKSSILSNSIEQAETEALAAVDALIVTTITLGSIAELRVLHDTHFNAITGNRISFGVSLAISLPVILALVVKMLACSGQPNECSAHRYHRPSRRYGA